MLTINVVVPAFNDKKFSGGVLCVLRHANELGLRGHRVNVVPLHPCPLPTWFPRPWAFRLIAEPPSLSLRRGFGAVVRATGAAVRFVFGSDSQRAAHEAAVRSQVETMGLALARYGSYGLRQGASVDRLMRALPDADITIATDCETAWPVRLAGRGQVVYFAQHYEPYFVEERLGGTASLREAEASYRLGLHQLVNSPWLQGMLGAVGRSPAVVCPNAIDSALFDGAVSTRSPGEPLRIISYGGRSARWKGFLELCSALRLLRERRPSLHFEWSVYGDALMPADNNVCTYRPLGFLSQSALAAAYRRNHLLLSASWYESFPLFPLEAMACGIAVITTEPGTELFARDGETALIVEPRNAESIAAAVERLFDDDALRIRLAAQGQACSRAFTWKAAGDVMERELVAIHGLPHGHG